MKIFINGTKIALKELRETNNVLKIILKLNWLNIEKNEMILKECNELIFIFVKSIETAKNKQPLPARTGRHQACPATGAWRRADRAAFQ